MPMKPAIKICGIRRAEDIEQINRYPEIKYAGFVFYPKSKRYITKEQAKALVPLLRDDIKAVGVFVCTPPSEIKQVVDYAGVDIIQLHSDEDAEFCSKLKGYKLWRAIRVKDEKSLAEAEGLEVDGFVLDGYTSEYGGAGKGFDRELAVNFAKCHFTMLAGGINYTNINQVYSLVKPDGIDLSSAVETDGFKDGEKIKQLIDAVRKGDI